MPKWHQTEEQTSGEGARVAPEHGENTREMPKKLQNVEKTSGRRCQSSTKPGENREKSARGTKPRITSSRRCRTSSKTRREPPSDAKTFQGNEEKPLLRCQQSSQPRRSRGEGAKTPPNQGGTSGRWHQTQVWGLKQGLGPTSEASACQRRRGVGVKPQAVTGRSSRGCRGGRGWRSTWRCPCRSSPASGRARR